MTSADQRITGPGELVQAVPYLLGFHPAASLVLVGLADGLLVVTARLDLADAGTGLIAQTVAAMCDGGTAQLIAALYTDADPTGTAHRVREIAVAQDCVLLDVLHVAGGRWRSLECTVNGCCPSGGRPVPDQPSAFAAAATVAGVAVLPDRPALGRQLDPLPEDRRASLVSLLDDVERRRADDGGRRSSWARSVKRAIFAAARAADEPDRSGPDGLDGGPGSGLDDDTVAAFGVALRDIAIRDSVWMAVDDGRLDGRALWRELGVRLPTPHDAAALFLFGWASWRAGNGALAGMAAERAVSSDPRYSAADLLLAALARGVDPRRLPRLRLPRSA